MIAKPERGQQFLGACAGAAGDSLPSARIGSATFSVMLNSGKQEVKLEDESDAGKPYFRSFVLRHEGRGPAIDQNIAGSRQVEQSQEVQQ